MTADRLLELQQTDSHIDLLRARMPKLPEVVAAGRAAADVAAWEQRAEALRSTIAAHEATITAAEHANEAIATKRDRLEKQLKTIIAPREAEALMHEIARLNDERSALDDEELVAMDSMAGAEAELAEHTAVEQALRAAAATANDAAAAAKAASEADIAASSEHRESFRAGLDAAALKQYDTMRGAAQRRGDRQARRDAVRWVPPRPVPRRGRRHQAPAGGRDGRVPELRAPPRALMLLWFWGTAIVSVWFVFRDPASTTGCCASARSCPT